MNEGLDDRILMPIAVRSTKGGSGKAGGMFGITYKVPDLMWDTVRQGKFLGVPFRYAVPDPDESNSGNRPICVRHRPLFRSVSEGSFPNSS
jgi:hypothetical protein